MSGFEELAEACQIFNKYVQPDYPTHCEHDVMHIMEVHPVDVSEEDKKRLNELGFIIDLDLNQFYSFKFGSA